MINSRYIKDFLEFKLNEIAWDYKIRFKGELDFYNYDWVKKYFGVDNTPFVLVTNNFETIDDGIGSVRFRYTLVSLPFEKDRADIEKIYDTLYLELKKDKKDDINIKFRPLKITFGEDFSEGSGRGYRRFEALFEFEGYATTAYNFGDLSFDFGGYEIPIVSFKFEHIKTHYINIKGEHESNKINIDGREISNEGNINNNLFIIETPLTPDSRALDFIGSRQFVGMSANLTFKVGDTPIFDNELFKFDAWSFSGDIGSDSLTAFLYFSYEVDKVEIKINGEPIPILDYAFAMATVKTSHTSLSSNIGKEIYLGKVRSWAFNVAEEYENDIIEILEEQMFGDSENAPLYEVSFKLYDEMTERVMILLLDDVSKETKETGRNYLTIKFVESGEV